MKNLYRVAIGFSGLAVLSLAWIVYNVALIFLPPVFTRQLPALGSDKVLITSLAVSAACLIISTIVTALTILLGWRNDIRQIEELKTRLQRAEAQRTASAAKQN